MFAYDCSNQEQMKSEICSRWSKVLTIIAFHVLSTFYIGASATEQIKWALSTYPVFFGENVTITCTIYDTKQPGHMAWKKCTGGQNKCTSGRTIGFNKVSADNSKYDVDVTYHEQQMIYELVIKYFNITDVNYLYKCESGFKYAFGEVSLNESIALPKFDQIQTTYDLTDELLTANIRMPRVYPRPRCVVVFKGRNITNMSNTTSIEQGILYTVVVEVFYKTKECAGYLTVLCVVGMRNITLNNKFDACPETATNKEFTHTVVIVGVITVPTLLLMVVVAVLMYPRISSYATRHVFQPIQMGTLQT